MNEKKKDKSCSVFHFDLYGRREEKYRFLNENSISSIGWNELEVNEPNYFFVKKDFDGQTEYEKGFKIDELFRIYGMGITTSNDKELVDFDKESLANKYLSDKNVQKVYYRLFDIRYLNYDHELVERPRQQLMANFLAGDNIGLLSLKGVRNDLTSKFGITNLMVDKSVISTLDNGYVFPLYVYRPTKEQHSKEQTPTRTPNLNLDIVNKIASDLFLTFTNEKEEPSEGEVCFANSEEVRPEFRQTFAPIDIMDYIYAVLHSPAYREKYKEFLKIDFPRVPYPKDATTFWKLVQLGGELRRIHLLESPVVEKYITQYPADGDNVVTKIRFEPYNYIHEVPDDNGEIHYPDYLGSVYINDNQYFADVPEVAWDFYIGGYQPAQKWLKDRKGRELSFEDILHYQKIIVALSETNRIMKEIDEVNADL